MTQHMVPLAFSQHQGLGWPAQAPLAHAASQFAVPVVFSELSRCIGQFPLAFVKGAGQMQLIALVGSEPQRCDYVHPVNGKWLAEYVPSWLRLYPFALRRAKGGGDDPLMCIDETALTPDHHDGVHPLFQADGSLHPRAEQVRKHLDVHEQHSRATAEVVARLDEAGLLAPWKAALRVDDSTKSLGGLYRLDESRLRALDDATLGELTRSGALGVAYAQLYSQTQLERLEKRARLQQEAQRLGDQVPEHLDHFFGEGDDDFSFDFDQ